MGWKGLNLIYWAYLSGKYNIILSDGFFLEKKLKVCESWPFFRVPTAGFEKFQTGGYGQIVV